MVEVRDVGAVDVVVDGLGQADDVEPLLGEEIGRLVGAVAAQNEEAVELHLFVVALHLGDLVHVVLDDLHVFIGGARRAEDGAAARQDAGKIRLLHLMVLALDQPLEAVDHADDLHVRHLLVERLGHPADGRVQSRTVTARR